MSIDFTEAVRDTQESVTSLSGELAEKFIQALDKKSGNGAEELGFLDVRQSLHDAQRALMNEGKAEGNILTPGDFRNVMYTLFDEQDGIKGKIAGIGRDALEEQVKNLPLQEDLKNVIPDLNLDDLTKIGIDVVYLSKYGEGVSKQDAEGLMHDMNKMRMERGEEVISPEAFAASVAVLEAVGEQLQGIV
jgi:hypothetical protein